MRFTTVNRRWVLIIVFCLFVLPMIVTLNQRTVIATSKQQEGNPNFTATAIRLTVQAALTPSPTSNAAATSAYQATLDAAINATLMARTPTPTNTTAATNTPMSVSEDQLTAISAATFESAINATLTARAPTATSIPTPTPQPVTIYYSVQNDVAAAEFGHLSELRSRTSDATLGIKIPAAFLYFSTLTVQQLTANNIQYIQLKNQPTLLHIYVNNQPLPVIIWDEKSLVALDTLYETFSTELGLRLVFIPAETQNELHIQLPVPVGQTEIPIEPRTDQLKSEEALALVKNAQSAEASINLVLDYDESGKATVSGISPFMLGMIGIDPDTLSLQPEQVREISNLGIHSISFQTIQGGGLLSSLNKVPLPYLAWSEPQQLNTMVQLASAMFGPKSVNIIQQLQLIFNFPGISIEVNFLPVP